MRGLAVVFGALLSTSPAFAECADDLVSIRGGWGQATFTSEIADTPQERSDGLMFRTALAPDEGMLFVYPRPGPASFWMKNTLIFLDMIFADETGRIMAVHENAVPGDLTPIFGGDNIQYVLEIPGGRSAELGISAGDSFQSPHIDQSIAVWRCP